MRKWMLLFVLLPLVAACHAATPTPFYGFTVSPAVTVPGASLTFFVSVKGDHLCRIRTLASSPVDITQGGLVNCSGRKDYVVPVVGFYTFQLMVDDNDGPTANASVR